MSAFPASVRRILPVLLVALLAACGKSEAPKSEAAPAPAAAAPAPAPQAAVPAAETADGGKGAELFKKTCAMCHQTGVAGAPKLGDKAAWAPRVATGKDALLSSVIKGKGAMPPKAGAADLKDDDLKAAIDYMLAAVK